MAITGTALAGSVLTIAAVMIFAAPFTQNARAQSAPIPRPAAAAQSPENLSAAEIAQKRSVEWEALARALDGKIAHLLPCDPRVRSDIEQVSHASELRLAAMSIALKAAGDRAHSEAEAVRAAVGGEDARVREFAAEGEDSQQEKAAADGKLADLENAAKRSAAFEEARAKLAEVDTMVSDRAATGVEAAKLDTALNASLREILVAASAREVAIRKEQAALAQETARWNDYYAARLARAAKECSITNPAGSRKK